MSAQTHIMQCRVSFQKIRRPLNLRRRIWALRQSRVTDSTRPMPIANTLLSRALVRHSEGH